MPSSSVVIRLRYSCVLYLHKIVLWLGPITLKLLDCVVAVCCDCVLYLTSSHQILLWRCILAQWHQIVLSRCTLSSHQTASWLCTLAQKATNCVVALCPVTL
jgi:hypothetical protein